jgi:hypothetical protein
MKAKAYGNFVALSRKPTGKEYGQIATRIKNMRGSFIAPNLISFHIRDNVEQVARDLAEEISREVT